MIIGEMSALNAIIVYTHDASGEYIHVHALVVLCDVLDGGQAIHFQNIHVLKLR